MSMKNELYPCPTIVIGVGRFGLATLEFLGEKWHSRQTTGGDASLQNLRLLHVDYDEQKYNVDSWLKIEKRMSDFLSDMRSDDMPSQALDMLILRTTGLVRFFNGTYQVALPKDGGFISLKFENGTFLFPTKEEAESKQNDPHKYTTKLWRRKYFDWITLAADPIASIQKLTILREQNAEFDDFVGTILHRVKLGHSPHIMLRMIFRAEQLCKNGSDPSPWAWIQNLDEPYLHPKFDQQQETSEQETSEQETTNTEESDEKQQQDFIKKFHVRDELRYGTFLHQPSKQELDELSDEQIEPQGWIFHRAWGNLLGRKELHWDEELKSIQKTPIRVPPSNLYQQDFETGNHASIFVTPYDEMYHILENDMLLLQVPDFQLGMYDHDVWDRDPEYYEHLQFRLQEYGRLVHQGLMLLWVEIEQSLNQGNDSSSPENVRQSLGFLGELLVKPILFSDEKEGDGINFRQPNDIWTDGLELPTTVSNQLQRSILRTYSGLAEDIQDLYKRLMDIGVPIEESSTTTRKLYTRIDFSPSALDVHLHERLRNSSTDTKEEDEAQTSKMQEESMDENPAYFNPDDPFDNEEIHALREHINSELRHLYNLTRLKEVNRGVHRNPPKLKIFVVGDFFDPFTRIAMQNILKFTSAEVFRAVNSIFQVQRGGVFTNTSIIPIIWFPNPTDPTIGRGIAREQRNRSAGVSLNAIHSLRKWISSIPDYNCNIRQILLNCRVTDNAYLGTREAVTQTAQFIEFQTLNDFTQLGVLDVSRAFVQPNKYFGTFACHLIDFPETRTREYFSTLLGLNFLTYLNKPNTIPYRSNQSTEKEKEPSLDEEKDHINQLMNDQLDASFNSNKGHIPSFQSSSIEDLSADIFDKITREKFDAMKSQFHSTWRTFVQESGDLDNLINEYHTKAQQKNQDELLLSYEKSNTTLIDEASEFGINRAKEFLIESHLEVDKKLRSKDNEISQLVQNMNDLASLNRALDGLNPAFENMKKTAIERLNLMPISFFVLFLGIWTYIGVASLTWIAIQYFQLHLSPSPIEWFLWRIFPFIVVAVILYSLVESLKSKALEYHQKFKDSVNQFFIKFENLYIDEDTSSLFNFFSQRLELSVEGKKREYLATLSDRSNADKQLGERLHQSVNLQDTLLHQKLEDLGVRLTSGTLNNQNPEQLFKVYSAAYNANLINPEIIKEYYFENFKISNNSEWRERSREMLKQLGGFEHWRTEAPLSDTNKILEYGREQDKIREFIEKPIIEIHETFEHDLWKNFVDFIKENLPNIGTGADYDGYEGLTSSSPSEIPCSLVLHEDMKKGLMSLARRKSEKSREDMKREMTSLGRNQNSKSATEYNDAKYIEKLLEKSQVSSYIKPNSIYLYNLATGISTNIIQNIRRYTSPLERLEPNMDSLFPYGPDVLSYQSSKKHKNPMPPFGSISFDWIKNISPDTSTLSSLEEDELEGNELEGNELEGNELEGNELEGNELEGNENTEQFEELDISDVTDISDDGKSTIEEGAPEQDEGKEINEDGNDNIDGGDV